MKLYSTSNVQSCTLCQVGNFHEEIANAQNVTQVHQWNLTCAALSLPPIEEMTAFRKLKPQRGMGRSCIHETDWQKSLSTLKNHIFCSRKHVSIKEAWGRAIWLLGCQRFAAECNLACQRETDSWRHGHSESKDMAFTLWIKEQHCIRLQCIDKTTWHHSEESLKKQENKQLPQYNWV